MDTAVRDLMAKGDICPGGHSVWLPQGWRGPMAFRQVLDSDTNMKSVLLLHIFLWIQLGNSDGF